MTDKVRWGVLSTAHIGTEQVIPAIQQGRNCEVVAIASRDVARGRKAADRLAIPSAYASYEELLADQDIDAVYNPLPNHLHRDWTIAAARAGKHVLCEKPLALNADEAQEMVDSCADAGVKLMEAFMYRLHPSWVKVRELVASGAIGELLSIQTRFAYFNNDPSNIRNKTETGGGALMDIGCYAINLSRMMFGSEPTRVQAAVRRDPDFGTDTVTSALLDFGDGQASFVVSTQAEYDGGAHRCRGQLVADCRGVYATPTRLGVSVVCSGKTGPRARPMTTRPSRPAHSTGLSQNATTPTNRRRELPTSSRWMATR